MLRSIVYQQLHGKAAATIHGRVLAELARHGGPTPEAVTKSTDAALRGAGLSGNKLRASATSPPSASAAPCRRCGRRTSSATMNSSPG